MKKTQTLLLSITMVASLFGTAGLTTAAVIFDNGLPNNDDAFFSDNDTTGFDAIFQEFDDFSLAPGTTTIRDVHWFGVYAFGNTPPATDDFTLFIYDNNAGVPGNLLHTIPVGDVGKVPTGGTIPSGATAFPVFSYSATISPITLNSGTTYWLSILNSTPTDIDDNWAWAESKDAGNALFRQLNGPDTFSNLDADLAFNLTDDVTGQIVPEPGTLLLLGGGMVGLAWRRLWKR